MSAGPPKRRLGRGLSALLPSTPKPKKLPAEPVAAPTPQKAPAEPAQRDYFHAQIEDIHPSPEQPRKRFSEPQLLELAESIRAHGVIQPLIVRERREGGFYLIAGERRWRASQRAGLHQVPVVVQKVQPSEAFERALVENLQRADLNPIEEAEAYSRLIEEYGYKQGAIAERVGKERSTVANALRLLKLPVSVRQQVEDGKLSMGHARALLGLSTGSEMEAMARVVVGRGLSVRAAEQLVRRKASSDSGDGSTEKPSRSKPRKSAAVRDLEDRLTKSLGSKTNLVEDRKGTGGTISLNYSDLDDLDRLLERLLK